MQTGVDVAVSKSTRLTWGQFDLGTASFVLEDWAAAGVVGGYFERPESYPVPVGADS